MAQRLPANRYPISRYVASSAMRTIDAIVEEVGISIEDLAAAANVDRQRLAAIVEGRWLPSPKERRRIAAALEIEVDQVSWGHTMSPRVVRYHRFGLKEDFNKND